ncbi:MAG: carboxypeptidase regulatory-like domain-containing protein [Planctomycetes bacterium]|nr:carboxypeptidase regulatory-like domain-containing protein [Planctomycetota bacterium]
MRDKKLVVAVLVLILLIGGAAGTYLAMQPVDRPGNGPQAGALDSGESGATGSGDPLAMEPGKADGDAPANGGDSGETGTRDPGEKAGGTETSNPGAEVNKQPVNPGSEPLPAEQQWEEVNIEMTVHGRVSIKSDGRPAVGAKVSTEISTELNMWWNMGGGRGNGAPRADNRPKGSVSGSTTTDGAGEYELKLKVTTSRLKKAEAPGDREAWGGDWNSEQIVVVATMAGYAPARSTGIFPQQGQDQEVNLKLAIPAAVSGRVIDAVSKQGIAGARGQLNDTEAWSEGGTTSYSFTTDEQGYFALNSLPASTYVANVSASGYANYNGWQGQGRINLSAGGEKDIGEIALMRAASVIGRVISEEDGNPLQGASIELRQANQWGGWSQRSGSTDAEGRFELTEVEPAAYTIRVHMAEYAPLELPGQAVEAGARLDLGDLKLNRGLSLSGVVVDTDNNPVAGASLRLSQPGENFGWMNRDNEISSATSATNGEFALRGVSQGDLQLSVKSDGFADYSEVIKVTGSQSGMRIRLSRGGTIRGRVLSANGEPVAGASISTIDHGSQLYSVYKTQRAAMWGMLFAQGGNQVTSGEDGRFVLSNVPEGTVLVSAAAEGNSPAYKDDVRVENDREVDVGDLRFAGKGSARITVTEDGAPVPDLNITLTEGMGFGGMSQHEGVTDAMGVALIREVPARTWYIRTARDEGTFDTDNSRRRIVIKEGETTELTLELRPKDGVHLHGRLTINGKATFSDIILIGVGDRSDVIKTGKPVEGGYYEFIGLKTGSYVLHARESDTHVTCKAPLDLREEGEFPFDHDFKGLIISGVVSTPDNTPAQRSSVNISLTHLENEKPEFAQWMRGRATPDTDGRFRFENVMPGKYQVSASLDGVGSATAQVTLGSADETDLALSISQNSGSIKLTVSKLNGTPVSGAGFGLVSLETPDGKPVDLGETFQGFFMLSEGARQTIPTVEPGTYTVVVQGSGFLPARSPGVVVENGKATDVSVDLTAAAELHLTFSNPELSQQMLDSASVRYFDAEGVEIPRETNVLDTIGGTPPAPERPTVIAKYIGQKVTEVRVKVAGYAELSVPVQFAQGRKIEKEETLATE